MTASSKKALSGTKSKAQTKTGRRPQPAIGRSNAQNKKKTSKRSVEASELDESSEEEPRWPHKKCSKLAEDTDFEEVDCNTSNPEEVVEVASDNGSESDLQVSIHRLHCKMLLITYLQRTTDLKTITILQFL
jgi:rRNA maturation endonuclease Nob1